MTVFEKLYSCIKMQQNFLCIVVDLDFFSIYNYIHKTMLGINRNSDIGFGEKLYSCSLHGGSFNV